jgi:hypothetical protein
LPDIDPRPEKVQIPDSYGLAAAAPGELLPWTTVEGWIEASRNYWVCTTWPDGRPHVKPVWAVWLEGLVLFSTHDESVTGRNLLRDPQLVVHLESGDEVAILEGEARRLDRSELLTPYVDAYERKYDFRPDPSRQSPPWSLTPAKVLSWSESEFPGSATRWSF